MVDLVSLSLLVNFIFGVGLDLRASLSKKNGFYSDHDNLFSRSNREVKFYGPVFFFSFLT